ncbi:hypothetical protein D3C71_1663110 [compost metagenome]
MQFFRWDNGSIVKTEMLYYPVTYRLTTKRLDYGIDISGVNLEHVKKRAEKEIRKLYAIADSSKTLKINNWVGKEFIYKT